MPYSSQGQALSETFAKKKERERRVSEIKRFKQTVYMSTLQNLRHTRCVLRVPGKTLNCGPSRSHKAARRDTHK